MNIYVLKFKQTSTSNNAIIIIIIIIINFHSFFYSLAFAPYLFFLLSFAQILSSLLIQLFRNKYMYSNMYIYIFEIQEKKMNE